MRIYAVMALLLLAGCQTAPRNDPGRIVVVGGSTVDLKALAIQMQKDPEARSAVEAVNSSFNVHGTGVKYCPVDGKHYSSKVEYCPEHKNVKLVPIEE